MSLPEALAFVRKVFFHSTSFTNPDCFLETSPAGKYSMSTSEAKVSLKSLIFSALLPCLLMGMNNSFEAGAVVQREEGQTCLGVSPRTDPSAGHDGVSRGDALGEDVGDAVGFHGGCLPGFGVRCQEPCLGP